MSNWTVEDRLTGEVVYAYGSETPDHFADYPLEQFNHILQKPVVEPAPQRIVTKLEYLRRFTGEERFTIRTVAKSNAVLDDYIALLELAEEVNLDDADTVGAVSMLEGAGLIATGRAAEILS